MLFSSLLNTLLSNAVISIRDESILYYRISVTLLFIILFVVVQILSLKEFTLKIINFICNYSMSFDVNLYTSIFTSSLLFFIWFIINYTYSVPFGFNYLLIQKNRFISSKYIKYYLNVRIFSIKFIYIYTSLSNKFLNNIYILTYINIILWVLSYNYFFAETLLYIYNNMLSILIIFLLLIYINLISLSFKEKHPFITFILSIIFIVYIFVILYQTLIYIMDLYYIFRQSMVFMNPIPKGPNNNPSSSSSNNPNNNPNKDPGSGSGAGLKNVDDDKKEKKTFFDFSKLDDLLNKNKRLFEENKKSVTTLENERHVEDLKNNISILYSNQIDIIKKHVDNMNKVNDVFSSKNRSEAKSILHKIREGLGAFDNLKDEFFKSVNSDTQPSVIMSFLTKQNEQIIHTTSLMAELEKIAFTAIEKDIKRKNLKESELKMYHFIRSVQLNDINDIHKTNLSITAQCLSIYAKMKKNQESNK